MAFSTLAQLVIVIIVLTVVVVLAVTQFMGLGRQTSEITSSVEGSVDASSGVRGQAICQVAGGTCAAACDSYALADPQGGCSEGFYCCAVVAES